MRKILWFDTFSLLGRKITQEKSRKMFILVFFPHKQCKKSTTRMWGHSYGRKIKFISRKTYICITLPPPICAGEWTQGPIHASHTLSLTNSHSWIHFYSYKLIAICSKSTAPPTPEHTRTQARYCDHPEWFWATYQVWSWYTIIKSSELVSFISSF